MSKYATINTDFKDRQCLLAAIQEMGYKNVEFHEKPQHLYGYEGQARPETAEIIIRRKEIGGASNDIGFKLNEQTGKYEAIISAFDSRKHGAKWVKNLTIKYQGGVAHAFAKKKGLRFLGQKSVKGKLRYQFQAL
jgi:hypothetical protein